MKHFGLLVLLFLVGCLPAAKNGRGLVEGAGTVTPTPNGNTTVSPVQMAWYQNFLYNQRLTLFRDNQSHVYLSGTLIENFLIKANDPSASYCLEFDMGSTVPSGDQRYARIKASPISVNNVNAGTKTLFLRVDFANTAGSEQVCAKGKVQFTNDSNTEFIVYSAADQAFNLAQTCTTCINTITSAKLKLFKSEATRIVQVPPLSLDLTPVTVALQASTTPGSNQSCTNAGCSAIGYNCCLENQCVNNGQIRNGVNTSDPVFMSTNDYVTANPTAYMRYPQYYYICGTVQPGDTPTTTGTSSGGETEAQARLKRQRADYKCIQHLKANAASTPYLQTPYTPVVTDQTVCDTTDADSPIFVTTILNRLYATCAEWCRETSLDGKINNCSKWDYLALRPDSSGQLTDVECVQFPDTSLPEAPEFSQVGVSSRSIPHRFFNDVGNEVDLTLSNPASTTQEGVAFSYNDPERMFPNNGTFNMNSVLGPLNLQLTMAQPAKLVKIKIDQVYSINTLDGVYATDCLECTKDFWYTRFSAFPTTTRGQGLRGINLSTKRDTEDGNTTNGNYEDTIFGRACWVPPTMLPFSQPLGYDAVVQRSIRLKTQAAMWVNGYRRDWYGFNKGALIGSFDGVSWFAIGKGRIIRSTTDRLYLAINAPFGDLASNNIHTVTVQPFVPGSNGAQLDYDPALSIGHPNQNDAGSCQASHICTVDSDCITKLGWEYVCADVSQQSTHWPTFTTSGAVEEPSTLSAATKTIAQVLAQQSLPGTPKRCVYRGAGAVCRTDASSIAETDLEKRKLLTCAPNFWCANVNGSNSIVPATGVAVRTFNKEVARFFQKLDDVPSARNHRFGQDANMLGRPLDYVHSTSGSNSLITLSDSQISATLNSNVSSIDSAASGRVGLCRPGKMLPYLDGSTTRAWNPFEQHQSLDQYSRTDYINQIASCPASFQSLYKTASCPVLDSTGNYLHQTTAFATTTQADYIYAALAQNSCGLETLKTLTPATPFSSFTTADAQQTISPFQLIEGKPLNAQTIVEKSITRDACLRKAGSVCHTDLDCSPSKLHADQLALFPTSYFGNEANRAYYSESLVCGQGKLKPFAGESDYSSYDLTKNRCCREIGESLSTYTAYAPSGTSNDQFDANTLLDPYIWGAEFPTDPLRYERFSSLVNPESNLPPLNAFHNRDGAGNLLSRSYGTASTLANVRTPGQWRSLNNANTNTCCGGGWMRKFSDGSVKWPIGARTRFNVNDFRCLNYATPLVEAVNPAIWGVPQAQLDTEMGKFCTDTSGTVGGCAQLTIQVENDLASSPLCSVRDTGLYGVLPTNVSTLPGEVAFSTNILSFFPPATGDSDVSTFIDYSITGGRRNVTIFVPSYVGNAINTISMQRRNSTNTASELVCSSVADGVINISAPTDQGSCPAGGAGGSCCYSYNTVTRRLKVAFDVTGANAFWDSATPANSGRYGVKINFFPPGTTNAPGPMAKLACKDYYYLDLLGRLELTGIPQITHPRILCNSNGERVVPNLYSIDDSDTSKTDFDDNTLSFEDPSTGDRHTNYTGVQTGQVFDPNQFKCCTPLGKITKNSATCCSGLGVAFTDPSQPPVTGRPNFRCMLPSGTDLNIYFNRFVSNEAINSELPSGGLLAADFSDQTGEPLVTTSVINKIAAIGNSLCNSSGNVKIRRGGAFGNYRPEPLSANNSDTIYGIVDSTEDSAQVSNSGEAISQGYTAFRDGYRWNHHTYCK